MDSTKTAAFEFGPGPDACLLLHGFTGSPWDLRPLGDALAERGYHVLAPRLPGHGTTPRAMSKVQAADWHQAAEDALEKLRDFRRVYLVGFSVGAMLSVGLTARHPQRIRSLALLAPAMHLSDYRLSIVRRLQSVSRRVVDWNDIYFPKDGTDIGHPLNKLAAPMLAALPLGRITDVFRVRDSMSKQLGKIRCPTLVVGAKKDGVVKLSGVRHVAKSLRRAEAVRFIVLENSHHILPRDDDADVLASEVGDFFARYP